MGIPGGGVISLSAAPTRNSSPSEAPRATPGRPAAMIAIATVSTPIPLDRVDTMLPSPFAETSDDATFRPSPAAPSHRILPRIIERSMAVKTADSMNGDRVCLPSLGSLINDRQRCRCVSVQPDFCASAETAPHDGETPLAALLEKTIW